MFLDIHDRSIKSADLNGNIRTVDTLPFLPGGFGLESDGGFIIVDALRRKIVRWESTGPIQIADLSSAARFCLGDSIVASQGSLYVGDVGFDFLDPLIDPVPDGVIVHVAANGKSRVVAENLFFPTGMIITADNKTLIVAEALRHCLTAFEIVDDGSLKNRRVWAQLQDDVKPDGICLDRDGAIWVAGTGLSALRVKEGGEIEYEVTTERPVYAAMLGGPERKHLFMCTSASNDPVITRQMPGATIDIAEVEIPGLEIP